MKSARKRSPVILHVAVAFDHAEGRGPQPLQGWQLSTAESARRRAEVLAKVYPGAVAFSSIGDPVTGEFGEPMMIASIGEVDLQALAA